MLVELINKFFNVDPFKLKTVKFCLLKLINIEINFYIISK